MRLNKIRFNISIAKKCLSIKELSNLSGVSTVTLNKLKQGNVTTPKTIGKIARALEVDVTEIIED